MFVLAFRRIKNWFSVMSRSSSRRIGFPLVFLALVLALLVVENLPGDAKAAGATGQTAAVQASDTADLPIMYE
jgi:flagellar biosynthesis protein FliR